MTLLKERTEVWDDKASNAQQRYLTHGIFRYFGKLPPTLTGRIMDEVGIGPGMTVADVMCGSGTTLIEAGLRGAKAIGVDCNDLSVLISKVKTTGISRSDWEAILHKFQGASGKWLKFNSDSKTVPHQNGFPLIRNFDQWFSYANARKLGFLREWISGQKASAGSSLAKVAFASCIRTSSNASIRTGRIFFDSDKVAVDPFEEFSKRLAKVGTAAEELSIEPRWSNNRISVQLGDARKTALPDAIADLVFCHPPYFALYRYSSDVLRFEMDWLGIDRKKVSSNEIEDGFKTTQASLVQQHIQDLRDMAFEASRIGRSRSRFVVVTADSTLRKERLEIIDPFISEAFNAGWILERKVIRKVRFAQALYHRSADPSITRPDDVIMIFKKR